MKRSAQAAVVLLMGAALAGCGTSRGSMGGNPDALAPLPAAPSGNVQSQPLPPPAQPGGFPQRPESPQVASVDPAQSNPAAAAPGTGADVSKNGMIGSWRAGGGENCQVFMTLTKMGSMSRGGSRGCSGDLQKMRGWDVKGKQVLLYDDTGNQIAALYNSGGNRYDGQTSGGQAISLSR